MFFCIETVKPLRDANVRYCGHLSYKVIVILILLKNCGIRKQKLGPINNSIPYNIKRRKSDLCYLVAAKVSFSTESLKYFHFRQWYYNAISLRNTRYFGKTKKILIFLYSPCVWL